MQKQCDALEKLCDNLQKETAEDGGGNRLTSLSLLVGGLEHFYFSIIYGIILSIDFHIFQRGRYTTNQLSMNHQILWVLSLDPYTSIQVKFGASSEEVSNEVSIVKWGIPNSWMVCNGTILWKIVDLGVMGTPILGNWDTLGIETGDGRDWDYDFFIQGYSLALCI